MGIVTEVFNLTTGVISSIGYPGIFGLMLLEGMLLPIPSEVVMAFGGYLIYTGQLPGLLSVPAFVILLLVGTVGNLSGALIAYYIGYYGGEPLIVRYGKYVFLDESSVKHVQRWFSKYGPESVFGTRLVPIFRTFISIPAGIGKMNIKLFAVLTFLGSLIWDSVLIYFGISLGKNWQKIITFFDQYQYVAIAAIVILLALFFINKVRAKSARNSTQ